MGDDPYCRISYMKSRHGNSWKFQTFEAHYQRNKEAPLMFYFWWFEIQLSFKSPLFYRIVTIGVWLRRNLAHVSANTFVPSLSLSVSWSTNWWIEKTPKTWWFPSKGTVDGSEIRRTCWGWWFIPLFFDKVLTPSQVVFSRDFFNHQQYQWPIHTVDGWNPAPVEVGSLSHYL